MHLQFCQRPNSRKAAILANMLAIPRRANAHAETLKSSNHPLAASATIGSDPYEGTLDQSLFLKTRF